MTKKEQQQIAEILTYNHQAVAALKFGLKCEAITSASGKKCVKIALERLKESADKILEMCGIKIPA